jgi:hypothetical protein
VASFTRSKPKFACSEVNYGKKFVLKDGLTGIFTVSVTFQTVQKTVK